MRERVAQVSEVFKLSNSGFFKSAILFRIPQTEMPAAPAGQGPGAAGSGAKESQTGHPGARLGLPRRKRQVSVFLLLLFPHYSSLPACGSSVKNHTVSNVYNWAIFLKNL